MNGWLTIGLGLFCLIVTADCWLGWQLLRQNGRILLRLDELEKRLDELEFGELSSSRPGEAQSSDAEPSTIGSQPADQSLVTSAPTNGAEGHRTPRFSNRSLLRSRIKRDGLKAGTSAPGFRLPRLDGGELSLEELRGKGVLLVFSDPRCGPCNALAPELEKFQRENGHGSVANRSTMGTPSLSPSEGERVSEGWAKVRPPITVVMISRGDPKENRAKVKEHGLTFPVVLQQRWEISRHYAMFATPVAYLIDEAGILTHDVAMGLEPILRLLVELRRSTQPVAKSSFGDLVGP